MASVLARELRASPLQAVWNYTVQLWPKTDWDDGQNYEGEGYGWNIAYPDKPETAKKPAVLAETKADTILKDIAAVVKGHDPKVGKPTNMIIWLRYDKEAEDQMVADVLGGPSAKGKRKA